MTSTLTIAVEAVMETNDHQARLFIDGKDWLGPEFLGLDPPMLKTELLAEDVRNLTVGRCRCGYVGCSNLSVEIRRTEGLVHWSDDGANSPVFDAVQYDAEVTRFVHDTSWETVGRTAEREIERVFRGTTIWRFKFDWASTRIQAGWVSLSYSKGDRQRILKFRWDRVSVADAIDQAKAFRAQRFPGQMEVD